MENTNQKIKHSESNTFSNQINEFILRCMDFINFASVRFDIHSNKLLWILIKKFFV